MPAAASRRSIEYAEKTEYRWVLDEGVPRFTPSGIFTGYVGSCIDMTEIKRAQEDACQPKARKCGQLARGIAHDFNNLLGGYPS
jgi:hypothetical protein